MRKSICILLLATSYCYGQYSEFQTYSNGLIYDTSTMHILSRIVDSLNLKFRSCELSHPYYSYPQGMATFIKIPNKEALRMIEKGILIDEFLKRYSLREKANRVWVYKFDYTNYNGVNLIRYSELPFGSGNQKSISAASHKSNDKTTGWVVDIDNKNAVYLEQLKSMELPFEYARLVQYVDCMIDTRSWDSLRLIHLDNEMQNSDYWIGILKEAVVNGIATGESDAEIEFYVARYLSKEDALKLMRSRKVMGNCSMDQSPRYHAMNICKLSAETLQWDIFLRSHLDIMNDRFESMSDGNYAWAGRKTYLKELEELDIPAVDLLIGTCIRVINVGDNHYFSSISRVGRGLSDASDKKALEENLLSMIKNEKLDPFNRLLLAYLFNHYSNYLDDHSHRDSNLAQLENAVSAMPEYVKQVWRKK
jgi:hypothetical protein